MIFEVEPTMRCNLNCDKCAHAANHKKVKNDEMTRTDWEHNLSCFLSEDELVISGGEPALYKDLEYLIDSWVEKLNKPVLRVTSNGYNWQRWLPLKDKISIFWFSHYPGINDDEIRAVSDSDLPIATMPDMPESNFWDIRVMPSNFFIPEEVTETLKQRCTLRENYALCKRWAWSCCVGSYFYRGIKGLPPYYGGVKVGSYNWRKQLEERTTCLELCRFCFMGPRCNLVQGEYIAKDYEYNMSYFQNDTIYANSALDLSPHYKN